MGWTTTGPTCKHSAFILDQVTNNYDPSHLWENSEIKVHIQEPRVGNPQRHTKLVLNNAEDYFEMERYRVDGVIKRILSHTGESNTFLNGKSDLSDEVIEKYRLSADRTLGHKRFYKLMYGLPMSINEGTWRKIEPAQPGEYEGKAVYRIRIELLEEMISKYWTLIVTPENYELLAIEFNHPDAPGKEEEVIKLEGEIEVNGIKIPRIRNWYIKGTDEYLGTDIIVEKL
jgi:hypothetical protein